MTSRSHIIAHPGRHHLVPTVFSAILSAFPSSKPLGAVFCCFPPFLLFFGECIVQTSATTNPACAGRSPLSTHLCRCFVLVPSSLGTRICHSFPNSTMHTSIDVIPSPCVDPLSCAQSLQSYQRLSSQLASSTPCPSPLIYPVNIFSAFIPIRKN